MRLSKPSIAKWAAALSVTAGLVSYEAAAIEELVVYGNGPAVATPEEGLRREMDAYVRALKLEHRTRVDASLSRERTTEIQIAATRIPTRG